MRCSKRGRRRYFRQKVLHRVGQSEVESLPKMRGREFLGGHASYLFNLLGSVKRDNPLAGQGTRLSFGFMELPKARFT
jgi:hypothetical protein